MSTRQLTDGSPVPEDDSHKEINPLTGQQRGYVVLTPEERAKGFVKPLRNSYIHETCGAQTKMGSALSETYARDPHFYSGTFCVGCNAHFPLNQFHWDGDKEPMDPDLQEAWHAGKPARRRLAALGMVWGREPIMGKGDRFWRVHDKQEAVRKAEADGSVADSLDVRKALIARMNAGELTLEQVQAELARIKRGARAAGKTTRSRAYREG